MNQISANPPLPSGETGILLNAAIYWRMNPPFALDAGSMAEQIVALARCIAAQIRSLAPIIGDQPTDYVLCTTMLTSAIGGIRPNAELFFDVIERECGIRPSAIVNTYMCVGWGYALRFFSKHSDARRVLMTIVDVDIHHLRWHTNPPLVGKSGFGVGTMLMTLPEDRADTAETGGPFPDSAFKDMVLALRSRYAKRGKSYTFGPFLTGEMGGMLLRVLGADILAPNRNDRLGHCFGCDPWIGVIEYLQKNPLSAPQQVLLGAIAFNGYYVVCPMQLLPETHVDFRVSDADLGALDAAIADYLGGKWSPRTLAQALELQ
jgi:hypothetical protein